MAVLFSPIFNSQVVNDDGDPAVGWKVYTYVANSSTPLTTYTTSAGNTQQSNPIVINALGFPTVGQIWLTQGQVYKLVLTDENDVVQKTEDQISGVNDVTVTQDQWVASGLTPTFVNATSFTFAGDQTSTFHVGRRLRTTNSGGTIYSTITASAFGALTTITVANDSGVLDSGLSAVSYGLLSYTNPSAPNNSYLPPGVVMDYGGSTAPTGWLECDGSAVSRGTYAALFSAISTVWGSGDGVSTFNLPDFRGRDRIGRGTGTVTESITNTAISTGGDSATVASNATKWVTGMQITWGVTGTPPTTNPANLLDNNDTVFIIRVNATTVQFATSLANAQAGTAIDITAAGSGTFTMTAALTARTIGQVGGEESHAQSSSELYAHTHTPTYQNVTGLIGSSTNGFGGGASNAAAVGLTIANTGGNAAMNVMNPFGVVMTIIKT